MTEGIVAVPLLEDVLFLGRFGDEKAETGVFENRSGALELRLVGVFVVAENDDAELGAIWVAVLIIFDDKNAH